MNESQLSDISEQSYTTIGTECSKTSVETEYGRLYVYNRDGTERAPFIIKDDILFGRYIYHFLTILISI